MSSSKRTSVPPKEWAKHLRPFGKKEFWSSVRNLFRSEEKEEMILEIDPEELKRNKEKYERELRASLNAEVLKTFRDVREEMGEPGPQSIDDVLVEEKAVEIRNPVPFEVNGVQPLTDIDPYPFPVYGSLDDYHAKYNDKPLPKIVTIEVSGLVGTGKIALLQLIDNIIQEKLSVVPLCAELEDKVNLININDIPQIIKDGFKEGKVLIEMRMKDLIKPKSNSVYYSALVIDDLRRRGYYELVKIIEKEMLEEKRNSILNCPCPGCGE